MKTLEIAKDSDVKHTRYYTLNHSGIDAIIFESSFINKIKPLEQAKKWAKEKGYTHLEVVNFKIGKSNKTYELK